MFTVVSEHRHYNIDGRSRVYNTYCHTKHTLRRDKSKRKTNAKLVAFCNIYHYENRKIRLGTRKRKFQHTGKLNCVKFIRNTRNLHNNVTYNYEMARVFLRKTKC